MTADDDLRARIERLQPWHFNVRLTETLTTADGNTAPPRGVPISVIDPAEIRPLLTTIYPDGLAGKSFLDVACNGGGYCVLAKRLGAEHAFGFDARRHWIDQAEFLKDTLGLTGLDFQHAPLHEADLSRDYDVCLFKGILYHLPDPVAALERVCSVTREVIIVDTETDGVRGEYLMRFHPEGKDHLMTGVHGLAWWPSGPDLVAEILTRLGFGTTREVFWRAVRKAAKRTRGGRCRIVAARSPELLARLPDRVEDPYPVVPERMEHAPPPPRRSLWPFGFGRRR